MPQITDQKVKDRLKKRKVEMRSKLDSEEYIIDIAFMEKIQLASLPFFKYLSDNIDNELILSMTFEEMFNNFLSTIPKTSASRDLLKIELILPLNYLASAINGISLEIESVSGNSYKKINELFDDVAIAEFLDEYGNLSDEDAKAVLKAIRNNFSHNREVVSESGYMSSVKITNKLNVLIDVFLKGKQTVVKTSLEKLMEFANSVSIKKNNMVENANNKLDSYLTQFASQENGEYIIDDEIIDSFLRTIPEEDGKRYTFVSKDKFKNDFKDMIFNQFDEVVNIYVQMIYHDRGIVPDECQILEIKQRLKHFRKSIEKLDENYYSKENEPFAVASLFEYLDYYSSFLTGKSNTASIASALSYMSHAELPFNEIINNFVMEFGFEKNDPYIEYKDAVFNYMFLKKELYPSMVMNLANSLFTNHEDELFEYFKDIKANTQNDKKILEIARKIEYKQPDLPAKLRNSVHHGRYMLIYPNKTNCDFNNVSVQLYDGVDSEHLQRITLLTISDIATLSNSFYEYIEKRRIKNVSENLKS